LKILQESFRICNWLMEKECNEIDNIFDINSYIDKIVCESFCYTQMYYMIWLNNLDRFLHVYVIVKIFSLMHALIKTILWTV
jgi:hypothetical protein